MKLTKKQIKKLRKLPLYIKRATLREIAINNNLSEMYTDVMLFTDDEIEQAYQKVLDKVEMVIENGS